MYSLVVPFHRDVARLDITFAAVRSAADYGVGEILLCHNGPRVEDSVWQELKKKLPQAARLLHTDLPGIGAGYRLGIENAACELVVLSASDLPFGFSDIEAFERTVASRSRPQVAIGSKAHRDSNLGRYHFRRKVASLLFYLARRMLLGRSTPGDSQGTIIARTPLARQIAADVRANDYFFSLEFLTLCLARGVDVVELPVTLQLIDEESSVSLVRDSMILFGKTWELRQRLRAIR